MMWAANLTVFDSRELWLSHRRSGFGIGASDVAAILAVPGWYTGPWDVWAAHHEPDQGQRIRNPQALERGLALEGATWALADIEAGRRAGSTRVLDNATATHPSLPWARCSPDAVLQDGRGGEGKTGRDSRRWSNPGRIRRWTPEAERRVPFGYALQVYWTMAVTGADGWVLAYLTPFYEVQTWEFDAHPRLQDNLLERVGAWRQRHLVEGVPPDMDGSHVASLHLADRHPNPSKELREADREGEALMRAYAVARTAKNEAEISQRWLGNQLRERIGDSRGLQCGEAAVSWSRKPGTIGRLTTKNL